LRQYIDRALAFHLGCDFNRDEEGTLCYAPKKYIEKMLDNYRRMFGTWPKAAHSPLMSGDHPELDTSDLLNEDDQKVYQSLIGALQWVIQIGPSSLMNHMKTARKRIAVVVQRYGEEVGGGAELHARWLAERLQPLAEIHAITTCAIDYTSWEKPKDGTPREVFAQPA